MGKPVLLAVDSEPDILAATQRDLSRRLAADYRIVTADTPEAAFAELDIDDQVALVMAGHCSPTPPGWISSMRATTPPGRQAATAHHVRRCRRRPRRGAGDGARPARRLPEQAVGRPGARALPCRFGAAQPASPGCVAAGSQPVAVRVVAPQWSARSHELRDLLTRNSVAHSFYDIVQPEGRQLLRQAGVAAGISRSCCSLTAEC